MRLFKNKTFLVYYGYLIETVLALLLIILLWQLGLLDESAVFAKATAAAWTTFFGVMLAGALAARLLFFTVNGTDFGAWIELKGVGGVYSGALLFYLLIFATAMAGSISLVFFAVVWLSYLALFVGIFALVCVVTFGMLIYKFSRLQAIFNLEHKHFMEVEKGRKN